MREMRDSGVEWIGEIPKDWNCCKQKYRFTLINGRAFKDNEFEEDGTYRILRVGNLFSNPVWYSSSLELEPDKYCEKGDLIYAWSMSYGPYIWNEEKVIYHYHIWKTKLVSDMDKMFSYYYLQALTESIKSQTHETTMGFVTMGIMNNSYIAYPRNIKEQKKISDYLDAKCSKIDEIIEKQLSIIEKLKEYKLSIITEAVTSGINPDVEMKDSGSVWFGNIPINWELKRLKYVFHIQKDIAGEEGHTVLSITQRGREAVDGRYGKDANRVLRAIDSAEKDCGIRLLEADPKAEGVIGSRVLPKGWVARKPSDIYWNGIRTFGIFCDYGLSIPEYVSLAVKLKEQKSVSRLGNRNDDAEENDKDDSDAGDIGNIRFWNLPIYHDDWRDNLTIELTQEEAFYLDKQIQKSTKGSLLEYVLKNHIDLNEYDDFASLTAELSEKVSEKLAYMMKLACDFNNLVYMARVRYNVMLSEDENTYANDEWSRLLPDIRHNATVDLDAVFGELQLINPRAKSFLSGIQTAFMASDIDMADELIRKRERSLKGAARAKLSRTKEFDHSKWVGGGMLDYRFSNARRIVNDIYAGEVNADV